jgi:protein SCO1/2
MLRQDKREVSFPSEINDGRVTIVSFVYTTCQTICPITSQTFSKLQEKKVDVGGKPVHLVSISIDPEHDTVSKLARYAEKYKADANWNFYTGSSQASKDIQKAFGIYQGDKMNHAPVYFIKLNSTDDWLRIDGLVTADFLFSKIQEMR